MAARAPRPSTSSTSGTPRVGILTLESTDGDPARNYPARERMLGWRDALDAAGIEPDRRDGAYRPDRRRARRRAASCCGAPTGRPQCCASPTPSPSRRSYAAESARPVACPSDLSVVGYDDSPLAAAAVPPLTTVRQEVATKGQAAVAMLVARSPDGGAPDDVLLPTSLVVRDSTAPPPA